MKNKIKNIFIIKKWLYYMFILNITLSMAISQELRLEQRPHTSYQSPVYKDGKGRIYSNMITVKFKEEVFNEKQREKPFKITDITFKSEPIRAIFENTANKYGTFSVQYLFPEYKYGINMKYNKRTKKMVEVLDLSQVITLNFEKFILVDSLIKYLKEQPTVSYAHGPIISVTLTDPNDTYYGYSNQWYLSNIVAYNAWNITKGKSNIKIDINDYFVETDGNSNPLPDNQQIYQKHVDINSKIVQEFGTQGQQGGPGWYGGHGTLVMGIAGALTNNQQGIASLGWNLSLTKSIIGEPSHINAAVNGGVDIINMSWYSTLDDYQSLRDAIYNALASGVICIASAGNGFMQNYYDITIYPPFVQYPAAYNFGSNVGQVIAVSGTMLDPFWYGQEDFISWWSGGIKKYFNYCPGTDPINNPTSAFIDVAAPGALITSTARQDQYRVNQDWGTSFSAPMVSALCGLILSLNDNLTPPQVYDIITKSADKIGSYDYDANGWNRYMGYGRINAYNALKYTLAHYGGTLTQDMTIPAGETWTFSSITVPSGITLTIGAGATVKFTQGSTLTVNGTLNSTGTSANRITLTKDNSAGWWSGIILSGSGSANSILSYCDISNVQVYGAGAVTILNVSGNPEISYCNISNNSGGSTSGVYYSNSNGYIYKNKLMNNSDAGLRFANSSSPASSKAGVYSQQNSGNNVITGNLYGLYATSYSYPFFGEGGMSQYGYNSIVNTSGSSLNVYASNGCEVTAEYNWWGNDPPLTNRFQIINNSTLLYSMWLSGAPTIPFSKMSRLSPGGGIPETVNNSNFPDLLGKARRFKVEQKYNEACEIYKSLIASGIEKSGVISSIVGLLNIYRENKDVSIMKYIETLDITEAEQNVIRLVSLINGYALDGDIESINAIKEKIQKEYPDSRYEKLALLQTAYLYKFNKQDYLMAENILKKIESKFDDEDILTAKWLIRGSGKNENAKNKNTGQDSQSNDRNNVYPALSSYPNPFNPSTKISYAISEISNVKLIIYNALGQEIETLVNKEHAPGKYEIEWTPKNITSGIYFYKLTANNRTEIKKLIYMK